MRWIKGFITFASGLVLLILGLGMWRSPEIDWEGFLAAWSLVINDMVRLSHDPFAIVGILVMIVGFLVLVNGIRRLVRG